MPWQTARRADRSELEVFLKVNEWGHVGFSSRIASPDDVSQTVYINRSASKAGKITEAILYTSAGLLIPVLSAGEHGQRDDIRRLFCGETPRADGGLPSKLRRLHSLMGLRPDVEAIQEILEQRCYASLDYHTMISIGEPLQAKCPQGVSCKTAKPKDAKLLYPLQKAYEIEEVLLDPTRFNPRGCMLSLQKSLRREIVMYAEYSGRAVAKAGTNAIGFTYAQLGGVYTAEDIRNRGIGECVLRELLGRIRASGREASLFVKKDNPAAIQLYRKLKFIMNSDFRIAYYR